jgi:hypothetical protein
MWQYCGNRSDGEHPLKEHLSSASGCAEMAADRVEKTETRLARISRFSAPGPALRRFGSSRDAQLLPSSRRLGQHDGKGRPPRLFDMQDQFKQQVLKYSQFGVNVGPSSIGKKTLNAKPAYL